MVSIAIVLILVLGIHQVFKLTSDTVGAGQALGSKARDFRAVQSTFYNDLSMTVPPPASNGGALDDGPFFLIRSARMTMFRSRGDQLADRDGDPSTLDIDGNNVDGEANVPGERVRTTDLNDRSHRLDRLMFFARGSFRRQTGGDVRSAGASPFVADMSSREAFLWYGHLQLPDYSTPSGDLRQFTPRAPGERVPPNAAISAPQPKNPINFYAADWALGRVAIALADATGERAGPADTIKDRAGVDQLFYRTAGPLPPLRAGSSGAQPVRSDDGWQLEWSRYDLLNVSIPQFRQALARYASAAAPAPTSPPWHLLVSPLQFQADPFPRRPLTAAAVARVAPIFLANCSQFAVEYAGDFVTQVKGDPYGATAAERNPTDEGRVISNEPDDVLDFVKMPDGAVNVRWYGLPRDTDGDGKIEAGASRGQTNRLTDVVPLRDVRRTATVRKPGERDEAPFERLLDERGRQRLPLPAGGDYAKSMGPDATYVVAWGPDTVGSPRPTMLRIVFALDDPAGRLSAAQTYEYVVKLP